MKVLQILFLFMCVSAFAQAQPPSDTSRNRMQRRDVYQELNLNKDQQEKVKALQEKQREEMQTIRNNSELSQEQQREQMMTLRKKYSAQIEALLTAEQKEKLKVKQKEMQEEMQQRRRNGGQGNN